MHQLCLSSATKDFAKAETPKYLYTTLPFTVFNYKYSAKNKQTKTTKTKSKMLEMAK